MIKTYSMIMEELNEYKAPANKVARMVKEGEYIPVIKGLYETESSTPGYVLAGSIYGPSYLSFDYALSYYGLIPEAVYAFTSATFEKKKAKRYDTPFGTFTYRDIPSEAYPLEVRLKKDGDYIYQIASPEKALCDKLYTLEPVRNKSELKDLLFENLRIDETGFEELNKEVMRELCDMYHCTNLKMLKKILR